MNSSGPPIAFSIWLTLFGCQIVIVALSRRRRRRSKLAASENNVIISQLPACDNFNDDVISKLSDDILISIISRVRTKDAVRTSVLSKRWANLYNSVPDIELRCKYLLGRCYPLSHDPSVSINAVDTFLRLRSDSYIRSLYLQCCLSKSLHIDDRFEQFIYSLGRKGVERLILHCSCRLWFSDLLFSCHLLSQMPSLKYFELADCSLIQTPSLKKHFELGLCSLHQMPGPPKLSPSNNSLQVLRLSNVDVSVGSLECILSNCLSLHSLSFFACKFHSNLRFCGPDLELRSLWIRSCYVIEMIEFYASNLVTFEMDNLQGVSDLVFDHVPKLQSVFLDFMNRNTMSCVCPKLVKDLSHVKSLILLTKGHIYQLSRLSTGVNTFSNLRQLSIRLYVTVNVDLLLLAPFLQRCPLLQEFHLDTEFLKFIDEREVQSLPFVVAHPELKKVEITGHGGTKHEIDFALYILKSATELEEMQIRRRPKWYRGCGRWLGRDKHPWNKQTLAMIHKRLQGQAISNCVRLTIRHSPLYEHTFDSSFFDHSEIPRTFLDDILDYK